MLRFEQVCKSYGSKRVLRNISHHFADGAFALRGPNGIGKSTLLAVLAGAIEADSGSIWIDQQPLHEAPIAAKARLAYVPDECLIYPFMTGRELLQFVAHAKRCEVAPQVMDIADRFGLDPHLDTRFDEMSLGTQKKTMLAAAWIGDPSVMLFDEPSNGLDAAARITLIDLVKARRGVVFISTHDHEFAHAIGTTVIEFETMNR